MKLAALVTLFTLFVIGCSGAPGDLSTIAGQVQTDTPTPSTTEPIEKPADPPTTAPTSKDAGAAVPVSDGAGPTVPVSEDAGLSPLEQDAQSETQDAGPPMIVVECGDSGASGCIAVQVDAAPAVDAGPITCHQVSPIMSATLIARGVDCQPLNPEYAALNDLEGWETCCY